MRKLQYLVLAAFVMAGILSTGSSSATAQEKVKKKRIAVFNFDDKTDHRFHWWTGQPVGDGMTDMLTTALVKSGKYTVIERAEMEKVLKEQQLGMSGITTPETAAKVGQVLGVEIAVLGAVTEFGHKKGEIGGSKGAFGLGVSNQAASVGIDVRLVNTSTMEILAAENVRKSKSKKGLKLRTEDFSFKNQNDFDESLVGKAAREAIDDVVEMLDKNAAAMKWQAKVVTLQAGMVIINAGSAGGVNVGDTFVVFRAGEELTDPDTGLSLGASETKIGQIQVTDNSMGGGKASKCKVISGSGFERGDIVREP